MTGVFVGVDLGGTKIRAALGDGHGSVDAQVELATHAAGQDLVEQLTSAVDAVARRADVAVSDVEATAVAGAGVPDHERDSLALAPNLTLPADGLAAALGSRLGHAVVLENDVNAAALGELHAGVGREVDSFVFVAVGTGIGMGVVADRRLLRGARGGAGEIGYLPLGRDPRDPGHRVRGPLEDAVSGPAIAAEYARRTGDRLATREVFARLATDADARDAVRGAARHLAEALVAVHAVVDPACLVLGGGVGSRHDLLDLVRAELTLLGHDLDLRHSAVAGDPALVGALRLAAQAHLTEGSPS
ncbi:ROK family protein [Aeromicrobium sp. IC_218]|uniref:ROK family protein n=1 Tax=Aeromicrobium sp. IC_218 TaxID=2545468 RepID=UPI0010396CE7|nr:ROK family protein [Aeromicrobium sp. IC_218]TCI96781.1 ROK family protein [Aeromicrobium sp. IC_218]